MIHFVLNSTENKDGDYWKLTNRKMPWTYFKQDSDYETQGRNTANAITLLEEMKN